MKHSIEIAAKVALLMDISLDYLLGNASLKVLIDTSILQQLENIAKMPDGKKDDLFNVIDSYIRYFKTSQAYPQYS